MKVIKKNFLRKELLIYVIIYILNIWKKMDIGKLDKE